MPPKPKPKQQSGFPITLPAPYVIVRSIGEGSFGSVYAVENTETKKHFAVKALPCLSADQMSKNESEISKLQKNQHKNVVGFVEVVPGNGITFVVMELCECSLSDRMKIAKDTQTKMDPVDVYRVINGVLEGLSFLHSRNLAFGDLKPSNILIGKDGTTKLGDFGGVTQTDVQRTSDPKELGSMKFWPPEFFALNKSEPSIASDMWGFGMILLELMTGREWIGGEQSVLLSQQIVSFDLQNAIVGFTENQQFLFRSLLAPNPRNRMTSSELLRSDRLFHILGDETPLSRYKQIQIGHLTRTENALRRTNHTLNAQITDLTARLTHLQRKSSTNVTPLDPVKKEDIIGRLKQAFPNIYYPKLYLRRLVEKYDELGIPEIFEVSSSFLKREASEYKPAPDWSVPDSIFSQYHASHPANSKYIQLAMKQLANDFHQVPIPIITKTFVQHCRLYIPTGLYLNDYINLDTNPPTFEGQPFNPSDRKDGNDDFSGQDPHFDADNSILDGEDDQFDDYRDKFTELHHPSSRLPPFTRSLLLNYDSEAQTEKEHYLRPHNFPTDTVQSGICPQCFFPLSAVWKEPHHFECRICKLDFHVE
ncbi:putative serine/threonine protein kinase [Blattamonas nauphoetae]|uniref:Serine/threonine protein kinase n=1 Tax=Blattamonas nauphoetae TaxID=2049346 RepID=A0ABQ9XTH1_9EUKA|nr:putative serine/threonine protein kinase [Blattamonas nauphoetae]